MDGFIVVITLDIMVIFKKEVCSSNFWLKLGLRVNNVSDIHYFLRRKLSFQFFNATMSGIVTLFLPFTQPLASPPLKPNSNTMLVCIIYKTRNSTHKIEMLHF
jgi:hypothetical protein